MNELKESFAVARMIKEHPTPWKYQSPGMILDANNKIVIQEGSVPQVIFDLVWTVYWGFLRPEIGNRGDEYY